MRSNNNFKSLLNQLIKNLTLKLKRRINYFNSVLMDEKSIAIFEDYIERLHHSSTRHKSTRHKWSKPLELLPKK